MTLLRLPVVFLLAAMLVPAAPAFAQDSGSATTIVPTRAPKEKRNLLVRNKFFIKGKRVEISPQFGLILNNPMNQEVYAGVGVTYHFNDRIGLEVAGNYAFLGGPSNGKPLSKAVLRLLDSSDRVESVDPGLIASVSAIWSPMYGKINPFGLAVINLDFYFAFGLGYGSEQIEMLALVSDGVTEQLQLSEAAATNHLFLVNFGFGTKVFITKWLNFKFDARIHITYDQVLDFDTEEAAARNRTLGNQVNRLTCHDADSGAFCKPSFPSIFALNFGFGFWMPGDAKVRMAQARRR